ncbi:hypothetical protein VTK56DRAFT_3959 [Thermocarpiscus australiensis]
MADDSSQQPECYVPDPKYTFCFAPDHDILCAICQESKLTLPSCRVHGKDSDPEILPCGHVFGKACLRSWLSRHDTCPVCRFKLRYELCDHPIPPLGLTTWNIFDAPRTVPDGGKVPAQCGPCRWKTDNKVAADLWMPMAKKYYEFKRAYERSGKETDRVAMAQARENLDKMMDAFTPEAMRDW